MCYSGLKKGEKGSLVRVIENTLYSTDDEDKTITIPNLDCIPDERGIGHVFFTQMKKYQDKTVQIDVLTGEKDTYSSLLQRCIRTALTMRSKGITSNDIVSLCTFNHLNSVVPFISAFFLGVRPAMLDPTLSLNDTIHLLKQVMPKMIFVIPEAVTMIEEVLKQLPTKIEIVVFGETQKHTKFSDFLKENEKENDFTPVPSKNLQDTALILFSSGTSGFPKGICIHHFSYLSQAMNLGRFGLDLNVILGFASLYWTTAVLLWGANIIYGTTRLILPKFDAIHAWDAIYKFRPTYMLLAPSQIMAMYLRQKPKPFTSDSLKDICIGGGRMTKEQMLEIRKIWPNSRIAMCYGQTEIGFICYFRPNSTHINFITYKPTSSGSGMPGLSYKVVDPETEKVLGPNQEGELWVKTKFQMNGYYNLETSDAWDSDGWLKTGDIAYYDEDKCFYIVDRIKEMLKFQSWHVPPAVIENVILTHPAIKHVVVIGVPHDIDGDHPMAVVVINEGYADKITPKDIEKYVEERVHDRQKLRGGVVIVNSLPLTPSGKVKRKEVKKMILRK